MQSAPKFALTAVLIIWGTALNLAADSPTIDKLLPQNERIEIPVKKSIIVKLKQNAEKVSIVAPEIADVHIIDPQQILITAASVGETSLIIWTNTGETRMIDLLVKWNTAPINDTLRSMLPDEAVEVVSLDDGVAIKGTAQSPGAVEQAMAITKSYVPNVVNLTKVPGKQQVLLKVKIAEVASSFRHEEGINFLINRDGFNGGSKLGNFISGDLSQGGEVTMSDMVTLFFGFPNSDVSGFVNALKERGWLHLLAEPNLVARSGETANFLAGGEFPIPVVQGGSLTNAITIDYKEFGVRLQFTPTVMENGMIDLDIAPEVSDLDFSNGVRVSGFTIPTIVTRRAHTVVQLEEGQTFAIAGLINQKTQKTDSKVPYAGDIPILGHLFRGKKYSDQETELLIMVTPYFVSSLKNGEMFDMPEPINLEEVEQTKEIKIEEDWQPVESTHSPQRKSSSRTPGSKARTEFMHKQSTEVVEIEPEKDQKKRTSTLTRYAQSSKFRPMPVEEKSEPEAPLTSQPVELNEPVMATELTEQSTTTLQTEGFGGLKPHGVAARID